ncbi:glutaredoxin domain-containing protein [Agrococcus sp. SGAir0287]|uniref:glutaredoxin domain-containing protein n=1 Tax=Agrococcus sp. SGAir0287 TaxID=2070347 RepID=UPI0010CCBFA1|nr:glutaredoxin domain-containing protein [Agrococcus sp. SGAir0287]QCR18094.1 hypothetical protein C1N71_00390 [Agrococcus sp. SGAir0287]
MGTITVYGKPGCVQCTATKRALGTAGVACSEVDVSTDDVAFEHVNARPRHRRRPLPGRQRAVAGRTRHRLRRARARQEGREPRRDRPVIRPRQGRVHRPAPRDPMGQR